MNLASRRGLTPQYEGLEAMHRELAPRGFAVLGFPSNDFMDQEPDWNFTKYLVDGDGTVVTRFGPRVKPDDDS